MRNVSCQRIRTNLTRAKASTSTAPTEQGSGFWGPDIVMIRQAFGCDLNVDAFDALLTPLTDKYLHVIVCEVGEVDCR